VTSDALTVREPRLMTAAELCALPEPDRDDELLGPLVVRGQRLLVGGHTGEGKTTLALQIVRAIVDGTVFLEWTGAGASRALVVDAEQGLRTIRRRLAEAGLDRSEAVDYVTVPDGLDLNDDYDLEWLAGTLDRGRYDVAVLDPLYKLHSGDSNDERAAVDLMRKLDTLRDQYGFALMLPVHCRKPQPGMRFSIHDLFGSTAFTRGAEVIVGLQRRANGLARLHWLKDRDGDLPIGMSWDLLYDREDGFTRDPDDGQPRETAAEKIARLLDEDPTLTQEELEKATGLAERTVRKARKQYHDAQQTQLPDDEA